MSDAGMESCRCEAAPRASRSFRAGTMSRRLPKDCRSSKVRRCKSSFPKLLVLRAELPDQMLSPFDLSRVLRQTLACDLYSNPVPRSTGAAVRGQIEQLLSA